jgi:hypothetical protein
MTPQWGPMTPMQNIVMEHGDHIAFELDPLDLTHCSETDRTLATALQ